MPRFLPALFFLFLAWCNVVYGDEPAGQPLTFEQHIRPILRVHCFDCHGAIDEMQGNLDLRLVRFQQRGGDSGPAIVAGQPQNSLLLERVRAGDMPPGEAKVTPKEIAILEQWIAAGAKTARPEPESIGPGLGITPEERAWWAFQPITRPQMPPLDDPRLRTPIDALLRRALPEGLTFSPDADRLTLLKRASFDLVGLPPTPEQLEWFLADDAPDAYERLIDELLASQHYGERWARHWLDIAGYADSEGGTTQDAARPWAYKYRDYVIRALNADKPLDRFLHEQLAGDELAGPLSGDLTAERIELLTATGFLRMAADGTAGGDNSPEARNQVVTDTLQIVSSSLLGMTVACAQCHDHRYDPIPQTDYYALRAVFEPALDWQNWRTPANRYVSLYTAADRQQAAEVEAEAQKIAAEKAAKQAQHMAAALETELMKFEEPLREQLRTAYQTAADKRTEDQKQLLDKHPSVNISPGVLYQYNQAAADELKKYDEQIAAVRAKKPVEEFLRTLTEPAGHAPETKLFHRGDYRQPKDVVAPAALSVVAPAETHVEFASKNPDLPTTGRRLAFARWLTSRDNPLTARVLVNRVWMHHFGRGLVATPADFGRLGTPPTHPELLDWLADELIANEWSLKSLHRTIMLSTAYRQTSVRNEIGNRLDAENRSYWRQNVVRLDAETLTDRMLAAAGQLDGTLYGKPIAVKEDDAGQVVVEGEQRRRSLYLQQRRTQPVALMQAFDAPVMQTNCELRPSSTVATQSLMLMNGEPILNRAADMAERVRQEPLPAVPPELAFDASPLAVSHDPLWQFGYGRSDAAGTTTFTPLPHWTGSSWQGGAALPDPKIGWVIVHATGGHAGNNADFCSIRRWTAPAGGTLKIAGMLNHAGENGDGVRGRVVSSRSGPAGEWVVQHSHAATAVETLEVAPGDTVDFVIDCREDSNSDSFTWTVELSLTRDGQPVAAWKSPEGFHGPLPPSPSIEPGHIVQAWRTAYLRPPTPAEMQTAIEFLGTQLAYLQVHPESVPQKSSAARQTLTNLCQALLSSNEFLYVD